MDDAAINQVFTAEVQRLARELTVRSLNRLLHDIEAGVKRPDINTKLRVEADSWLDPKTVNLYESIVQRLIERDRYVLLFGELQFWNSRV